MAVDNSSKNVEISEQQLDECQESLQEEKDKLKKQIEELNSIILEMQWNLDLCAFKKIKTIPESNISSVPIDPDISKVPNINVELASDLFRFAGFRCIKFTKNEFIFNFSSQSKYDKDNIFAVQILHKKRKWTLGKWVMPISIDLEDLVCQFSNDASDIPCFLKACKHYIDCYFLRCEQYNALKETVSHLKNCTLQTNDGYTNIILNLMGVHNVESNAYLNIDIHLRYNFDEIWPQHITVDSQTHQQLNTQIKQQLKESLICFKLCDLCKAFEKMFNDTPFTWSKEDDEDSPLEISNASGSDEEGFLDKFSFRKKETISKTGKKRKRKVRDISKAYELNTSDSVEENNKSITLQNEEEMSQNHSEHSINQNMNATVLPAHHVNTQYQKKLKQTKLKFKLNEKPNLHMDPNTVTPRNMTSEEDALDINLDKVITSTPMHRSSAKTIIAETSNDISVIVNDEHPQSTTSWNKSDIDSIEKQKVVHKKQPHKNVPSKTLQTKMKKTVKSVIESKVKNQNKKTSKKFKKKT
ncbi:uncharacterized protein LOC116432598 [Nomia melanderi]|uniref:uncharacterized protein LOC116432598 n=1 Tax=Nomia melanderi TaxID=2448451 RepID=UPI003FCDD2A3